MTGSITWNHKQCARHSDRGPITTYPIPPEGSYAPSSESGEESARWRSHDHSDKYSLR